MRNLGLEPKTVRALAADLAYGVTNTVFAQIMVGGTIFTLFLSELGLNKTQIGLVLSLLPWAVILAVFVAPAIARRGYRRVFLTFWSARKGTMALVLLAPPVAARFGVQAAFLYLAGVYAVFAVCRAVAENAYNPWTLEFIPNEIRAKFQAVMNVLSYTASFLAILAAGAVLGRSTDISRFTYVFAGALVFGLLSIVAGTFLPGGAPRPPQPGTPPPRRQLLAPLADRRMRLFLGAAALFTLAFGPLSSFLPLFMRDVVGLRAEQVVLLTNASLIGSLLSAFVWGWLTDRYGSKPMMLFSVGIRLLLPIFWLSMPHHSPASLYVALGIAFVDGMASMGWGLSSAKLLYVTIVPPDRKTEYLSTQYTWAGIVGGVSPLVAGFVLDRLAGIAGHLLFFQVDAYTALFASAFVLSLVSITLIRRIPADSDYSVGRLAGMLLRRLTPHRAR